MSDKDNDLLDPAIAYAMRVLVLSEYAGVQVFAARERLGRRGPDKQMWAALHELETQTRAAVLDVLGDDAQRFVSKDKLAAAGGAAAGTVLVAFPHRLQLRALVEATRPFMPHFSKLAEHFAGTPRAPFFDYILAHERAIAEVGHRALVDDPAFLSPVEALLGNVPR